VSAIHYLLWSNKHAMWWRPDGRGYTEEIAEAGAYTEAEAVMNVLRSALSMDRDKVTLMVAAPPGWTPPAPEFGMFATGPLVDVLAKFFESSRNRAMTEMRLPDPGGEAAREAPPKDLVDLGEPDPKDGTE
jgi:hypothetical protein